MGIHFNGVESQLMKEEKQG